MRTTIYREMILAAAFVFFGLGCNEEIHVNKVRKLTFALTNDIHGHIEPLTYFAETIKQLRNQPEYQLSDSGFILLDSGDQFQGTLLSNYDEGRSVIQAMNEIGYDAAVPGNHDYDFGPYGWLEDKVVPGKTSNDPKEVIKDLSETARFPLLSANTYYKKSIKPFGSSISVDLDSQCKPLRESTYSLDFIGAARPDFLKPYQIIKRAGVRIALIGIDHHLTSSMTTQQNVSDLCFRNEVDSYIDVRRSLEGSADVFVLLLHNGNTSNSKEASEITQAINKNYPNGVNLVAAGHTHMINNEIVDGVPVIQDSHSSQMYGLVDLYFDEESKKIVPSLTKAVSGIKIKMEGATNSKIDDIIASLQDKVAPLGNTVLAHATEAIKRDRIGENALGNILTDSLRQAMGTDITFMNAGGIRIDFDSGEVTYKNLFEALPFNNIAVTMEKFPWRVLKAILSHTIQTCSRFGVLNQSGLKVQFARTCTNKSNVDLEAKLLRVETLAGELLYDANSGKDTDAERTFTVGTLDFIAAGGDEFKEFNEVAITKTNGIARELIAQELSRKKPVLKNSTDGRFEQSERVQR